MVRILHVTVGRKLLILKNVGRIFFLQEYKKNPYALQLMESNYKKYASVLTDLKFDMFIVDHRPSYYINIGVSRSYNFFAGYTNFYIEA